MLSLPRVLVVSETARTPDRPIVNSGSRYFLVVMVDLPVLLSVVGI